MKKNLDFIIGGDAPIEIQFNPNNTRQFFSDLLEVPASDLKSIVKFMNKWGISPLNFINERIDPYSYLQEGFKAKQLYYSPVIKKVLTGKYSELTEDELKTINDNLAQVYLKIDSPMLNNPTKGHSHITCFYSEGKLSMDVMITRIGHPEMAEKEARLKCILTPKGKKPYTYKKTRVDEGLISYLAKESGAPLIDKYKNKWIVESAFAKPKEDYSEITLYIEDVSDRGRKDSINELKATTYYSRTLEQVICKMLWTFLSIPENQRLKKLCIICYSPVSRKNSNHCGSKSCKDRIKSLRNQNYYKSSK